VGNTKWRLDSFINSGVIEFGSQAISLYECFRRETPEVACVKFTYYSQDPTPSAESLAGEDVDGRLVPVGRCMSGAVKKQRHPGRLRAGGQVGFQAIGNGR
jgi:hypothetical protein